MAVSIRWRLDAEVETWRLDESEGEAIGTLRPNNPGSAVVYYNDHIRDDGWHLPGGTGPTTRSIYIDFDEPSPAGGTITFTTSGTAVHDTHWHLVTPSPLIVNPGASQAVITIDLLDSGSWFLERTVFLTLTGGSGVTIVGQPEYHWWIYSQRQPPTIGWNIASQTGGEGVYNLNATISEACQEDVRIYYGVDAPTLVEDTHFILTVEQRGGGLIAAGNTSTTQVGSFRPQFQIPAAGATQTGHVIDFWLDHEPADLSRRNWWTYTGDWTPEVYQLPFAGEPSPHGFGGGQWLKDQFKQGGLVIGQDQTLDPETGLPFWSIPEANWKRRPDGVPMQAILMRPQYDDQTTNSYIRASFEGEAFSGLPPASAPLKRWNIVSVCVDTFPSPEDSRTHQFVALTMRTRLKNLENRCIFWRLSDGDDASGAPSVIHSNGATLQTVTLSTGTWGFWTGENLHALDEWGAEEEIADVVDENGVLIAEDVPFTRLWFAHHVPDAGFEYTNNDGDPKTQVQGDIANVIMRFSYYSGVDNSGSRAESSSEIAGGTAGVAGKGFLVWGPAYLQQDDPWPDPPTAYQPDATAQYEPGRFWQRPGSWNEPRGNAYCDPAGGIVQHTFTVS